MKWAARGKVYHLGIDLSHCAFRRNGGNLEAMSNRRALQPYRDRIQQSSNLIFRHSRVPRSDAADNVDMVVDPFAGNRVTREVSECWDRRWLCAEIVDSLVMGAVWTIRHR